MEHPLLLICITTQEFGFLRNKDFSWLRRLEIDKLCVTCWKAGADMFFVKDSVLQTWCGGKNIFNKIHHLVYRCQAKLSDNTVVWQLLGCFAQSSGYYTLKWWDLKYILGEHIEITYRSTKHVNVQQATNSSFPYCCSDVSAVLC